MENPHQFHPYSSSASAANTSVSTPKRTGSPASVSASASNAFDDIMPQPRQPTSNPFASPFTSPSASKPSSIRGLTHGESSAVDMNQQMLGQRYFYSRRVKKGEVEKPWLLKKDPREKWVTIIPIVGLLLGLAASVFLVYDGMKTVVNHKYCPVLDENWSEGFNTKVWTKEAELGGFR